MKNLLYLSCLLSIDTRVLDVTLIITRNIQPLELYKNWLVLIVDRVNSRVNPKILRSFGHESGIICSQRELVNKYLHGHRRQATVLDSGIRLSKTERHRTSIICSKSKTRSDRADARVSIPSAHGFSVFPRPSNNVGTKKTRIHLRARAGG